MVSELGEAEAAFNFETGYMDDGLVVGRSGGGIIDVVIKGVQVHSGIEPEKGRSAVAEMAYKIIEIESRRDVERGKLINCGMVSGGIGENTVPGEAKSALAFVSHLWQFGMKYWMISNQQQNTYILRIPVLRCGCGC